MSITNAELILESYASKTADAATILVPARSYGTLWMPLKEITTCSSELCYFRVSTNGFSLQHAWF